MALTVNGLLRILEVGLQNTPVTIRLFNSQQDYPASPTVTKAASFGSVANSSVSLINNVVNIPSAAGFDIIDIIQGTSGSVLYKEDVQLSFANEGSLTFNLTINIPAITPFVAAGINRMLIAGLAQKEMSPRFFIGNDDIGTFGTVDYATEGTVDAQAGTAKISLNAPSTTVSVLNPPKTVDSLKVNFVGGSAENFIDLATNFSFIEEGTLTIQDLEVILTN